MNNTSNPLVEIVIVNYNGYDDTVECIKSLKQIKYNNYFIVVFDNGSITENHEEDIDYLKSNSHYIYSKVNRGFSGGNNQAIIETLGFKPDYYLLLNNDTVVKENFLDILVESANNNQNAGIICGKINYYYDKEYLWFAGGTFNPITCSTRHVGIDQKDCDFSSAEIEIDFATGCMWLIPNIVIETVGMLDDEYFLYCEDTDFCIRVRNKGYLIIYCNAANIYHKVSRSSGASSSNTQYYITRNELYIIKKYSTNKLIAYPVKIFRFIMDIIKGRKEASIVWEAIIDFITNEKGARKTSTR